MIEERFPHQDELGDENNSPFESPPYSSSATATADHFPYSGNFNEIDDVRASFPPSSSNSGQDASPSTSPLSNYHYDSALQDIPPREFDFTQTIPFITDAVQALAADRFSECFTLTDGLATRPWNWNFYLFPMWLIGVVIRYGFLLPIRMLIVFGALGISVILEAICLILPFDTDSLQLSILKFFLGAFLFSMSAVINVTGTPPPRAPNQLFIANHTSPFDWCFLSGIMPFAPIGQINKGLFGFVQRTVMRPLNCLWFERFNAHDRVAITELIQKRARDPHGCPLLMFPEGVCVNNQFLIMFKRGVFSIDDIVICPIALHYDLCFSRPYWISRERTFVSFLLSLLSSWCVVLNVSFLDPIKRLPNEDPGAFAARCRRAIAVAGEFKVRNFDGYFKYHQPSEHYREARRRQFASTVLLDSKQLYCMTDQDCRFCCCLPSVGPRPAAGHREEEAMAADPSCIAHDSYSFIPRRKDILMESGITRSRPIAKTTLQSFAQSPAPAV